MEPNEVLRGGSDLPDAVVRYADHADGIIDIHLPPVDGNEPRPSSPLVVLIHGGFWRAAYDRVMTRPLAKALALDGSVVATPEYRRVGATGELAGGWPATFDDVSAAMAALPGLLEGLEVPVHRTTVMGHSAGGHLALWLANQPYPVDRVVGIAPVGDLRAAAAARTGDTAVPDLLGGSPSDVPDVYDAADPASRFATRPSCEVVVIHGTADDEVPVENSRGFAARHPFVVMRELDGVDHFDVVDPETACWPVVRAAAAAEPFEH